MRALRFERFGDPSVLRLVEVARPPPSAGEALVEVRAAAINPSDVKNVAGKMRQTTLPRTPGRDFAGVVVAGPREWEGAEVWGTGGDLGFTRDGTHAEALLVPVAALRRKPKNLTFAEAAAVGTPFLTAHLGLTQASLRDGEAVLVVGAAGAVGSAAVQIARWRGASVVAVVRDERQAEAARAFGATQVLVERPGEDAVVTLAGALGADAIDLAFDTSGVSLDACVHVLHRGGRTVVITAPPDGKTTFDLRELYRREAKILGVDSLQVSSTDAAAILDELAAGFASGRLRPPALTERPLADAVAAYETRGHKLVLIP